MVNQKGQVVKGSGRYPNANNAAAISKITARKRSRTYQEAMYDMISVDEESGKDAIISLEKLLDAAAHVATGKPKAVTCPACNNRFLEAIDVDSKVLVFLLERILGKATETKDVNIRSEQIVELLRDESVNARLEIVALDPRERSERQRTIEAEFARD